MEIENESLNIIIEGGGIGEGAQTLPVLDDPVAKDQAMNDGTNYEEEEEEEEKFHPRHDLSQLRSNDKVLDNSVAKDQTFFQIQESSTAVPVKGGKIQVITESSSPVLVWRNNSLQDLKLSETVDPEMMIGELGTPRLMYDTEHMKQYLSAGNKRFMSIPMVLVGPGGKEALFVETGLDKEYKASRGTNVRPLSLKDLANTLPEQKDFSWKAFQRYVVENTLDTPQKQHTAYVLLFLCAGVLSYPISPTNRTTNPFDFQVGETTNTPQLLLTFGEAIFAYSPQIQQITMLMICYIGTWMLVLLPIEPVLQLFSMLLLVCTPFFYFLQLAPKASSAGVDVACGRSIKLPLIGFATLGAAGISLICVLMTLLIGYSVWRFLYKGKTRVMEVKVSSNDLSKALEG